jgi:hypothetical protein
MAGFVAFCICGNGCDRFRSLVIIVCRLLSRNLRADGRIRIRFAFRRCRGTIFAGRFLPLTVSGSLGLPIACLTLLFGPL